MGARPPLTIVACLLSVVGAAPRVKRQLILPGPNNNPFPGRSPANLFPLFPFTHQYSNGVRVDEGHGHEVTGELNIPIPTWGIWDFTGHYEDDLGEQPYVKVGELVRPVNPHKINPYQLTALGYQPQFQAARAGSPKVPVGLLPFGFVPARCRPPFCNPFVGQFGVGVEVEDSDDDGFEGGLDFPVPIAPGGFGVRFPLSGGFLHETSPVGIAYGIGLSPVDAFRNLDSGADPFRRRPKLRRPFP